jgi:YHS domain-containing protein
MLVRSYCVLAALAGPCLCSAGAMAQHANHHPTPQPAATPLAVHSEEVIPYLADTCPISGEKLGEMGDPVVREYGGREVRFCCKSCIEDFEADQNAGFKKLDAIMIKAQLPFYPVTTCLVSGEPLTEDGEDIAVDRIYKGRLIRFCCTDCVKEFEKDPKPTLAALDAAVLAQQRPHYPLNTCPVSGEELGGMGEPYEVVVGNRLVRLCCESCEKDLLADPVQYLKPLDAAWKAAGFPHALDRAPEGAGHEDADKDADEHSEHNHGG